MAACAGLWRPSGAPPDPLSIPFQLIRWLECSIIRFLDAGGWLGLSAGGWLLLSQLWWLLCMLVQKGCWLASMLCLGSHTLDALRVRRIYKPAVGINILMIFKIHKVLPDP